MRGRDKIVRPMTVRLQRPVRAGKCKYIAETVMRYAFKTANVPTGKHGLVPVIVAALKTNVGLGTQPGWYVDRVNKRRRR
jgi:hypothetical protein